MLSITAKSHLHPTVNPRLLESVPVANKFNCELIEVNGTGPSHLVKMKPGMRSFIARRGNRTGFSHMTLDGEKTLTNKLCVVQCPDSWGTPRLISAFWAVHIAPKEPTNFKKKDKAIEFIMKGTGFWATHALIPEEGEELHDIVFIDNCQ